MKIPGIIRLWSEAHKGLYSKRFHHLVMALKGLQMSLGFDGAAKPHPRDRGLVPEKRHDKNQREVTRWVRPKAGEADAAGGEQGNTKGKRVNTGMPAVFRDLFDVLPKEGHTWLGRGFDVKEGAFARTSGEPATGEGYGVVRTKGEKRPGRLPDPAPAVWRLSREGAKVVAPVDKAGGVSTHHLPEGHYQIDGDPYRLGLGNNHIHVDSHGAIRIHQTEKSAHEASGFGQHLEDRAAQKRAEAQAEADRITAEKAAQKAAAEAADAALAVEAVKEAPSIRSRWLNQPPWEKLRDTHSDKTLAPLGYKVGDTYEGKIIRKVFETRVNEDDPSVYGEQWLGREGDKALRIYFDPKPNPWFAETKAKMVAEGKADAPLALSNTKRAFADPSTTDKQRAEAASIYLWAQFRSGGNDIRVAPAMGGGVRIAGDTYPMSEEIKASGGKWDGVSTWEVSRENLTGLVARMSKATMPVTPNAESRARAEAAAQAKQAEEERKRAAAEAARVAEAERLLKAVTNLPEPLRPENIKGHAVRIADPAGLARGNSITYRFKDEIKAAGGTYEGGIWTLPIARSGAKADGMIALAHKLHAHGASVTRGAELPKPKPKAATAPKIPVLEPGATMVPPIDELPDAPTTVKWSPGGHGAAVARVEPVTGPGGEVGHQAKWHVSVEGKGDGGRDVSRHTSATATTSGGRWKLQVVHGGMAPHVVEGEGDLSAAVQAAAVHLPRYAASMDGPTFTPMAINVGGVAHRL